MEEGVSLCSLEEISEFEVWARKEEKRKVFAGRRRKPFSYTSSPLEISKMGTRVPLKYCQQENNRKGVTSCHGWTVSLQNLQVEVLSPSQIQYLELRSSKRKLG